MRVGYIYTIIIKVYVETKVCKVKTPNNDVSRNPDLTMGCFHLTAISAIYWRRKFGPGAGHGVIYSSVRSEVMTQMTRSRTTHRHPHSNATV
jgi:hypothetical protein